MAKSTGFTGSGLVTDYAETLLVTIKTEEHSEKLIFNKILTDRKIMLDGVSKFITVIVPASKTFVFQLVPII